jgi:hypothetical protein
MIIGEWLFLGALGAWLACTVCRVIGMHGRNRWLQGWRRWDFFNLIPSGAFFSPHPPPTELCIVIRDFFDDGTISSWTEVPSLPRRSWTNLFWAPRKHLYRAKFDVARNLLDQVARASPEPNKLPASWVISDAYLAILRFAATLPRISSPCATQFAVLEYEIVGGKVVRAALSSVHQL